MKYQDWLDEVPKEIKNDAVWNLKVYRAALFLSDLSWEDAQQIIDHKEKARFYEIALGSARESKGWYFKSRHILGRKTALHRIKLMMSIIKLLLRMINEKRGNTKVSEPELNYFISNLENKL